MYGTLDGRIVCNIEFDDVDTLPAQRVRVLAVSALRLAHGGENRVACALERLRGIATKAGRRPSNQNGFALRHGMISWDGRGGNVSSLALRVLGKQTICRHRSRHFR